MGDVEHTATGAGVPDKGFATDSDADFPLTAEQAGILEDLTAAFSETDSVPSALVEAARQSWTWRSIDADLAELSRDTADQPASVRAGSEGHRLLTFEAGDTAVIVEVSVVGRLRRLLGQITLPRAAEIEVHHVEGTASATADALGRFSVDAVPSGPISLVCRFLDGMSRPVATSWVAV